MTRSGRILRLLAFLTGLTLLVQAASAVADDESPPGDWVSAPCATGGFTEITASWDDDSRPSPEIRFEAWIQPCKPAEPNQTFAFTLYTHRGWRGIPRMYKPGRGATSFTGVLNYRKYRENGHPRAVCVSFSPVGRTACVELDTLGTDGLPVGVHIDVNDRRVLMPADTKVIDPTCGSCL